MCLLNVTDPAGLGTYRAGLAGGFAIRPDWCHRAIPIPTTAIAPNTITTSGTLRDCGPGFEAAFLAGFFFTAGRGCDSPRPASMLWTVAVPPTPHRLLPANPAR